jgi:hypothetical protein
MIINGHEIKAQADLHGADLRGAGVIVMWLPSWAAYVTRDKTRIGCEWHENDEWLSFDDDRISRMDPDALDWWRIHKPLIAAAIAAVGGQDGDDDA